MPTMQSLTAQVFAGKYYVTGDEFFASEHEARVLVALGRAKVAKQPKAVADAPAPRTRRAYTRRDMTAEQGES
jgi:hypothetical protein